MSTGKSVGFKEENPDTWLCICIHIYAYKFKIWKGDILFFCDILDQLENLLDNWLSIK